MRTILIAAAAAAVLSLPGAALAQGTGPQDIVPSSEHQNSSHANAPGNSGEAGYSTGSPRAVPTSDTHRPPQHPLHTTRSSNPNSTMSGPNETNSSQPTDQSSGQSPQ